MFGSLCVELPASIGESHGLCTTCGNSTLQVTCRRLTTDRRRYQCSLIAGTVFASTKLPLTTWFLGMHLLTQAKTNLSALELSRDLDVSYRSAWLLKHKVMETMWLREQPRQRSGRVEIDDAYLGGQRSGGKPGRDPENKVPFVAAVQIAESGLAIHACRSLRPFTNESMRDFAGAAADRRLRRAVALSCRRAVPPWLHSAPATQCWAT